jgi:hypothetical protein
MAAPAPALLAQEYATLPPALPGIQNKEKAAFVGRDNKGSQLIQRHCIQRHISLQTMDSI